MFSANFSFLVALEGVGGVGGGGVGGGMCMPVVEALALIILLRLRGWRAPPLNFEHIRSFWICPLAELDEFHQA